MMLNWDVYLYKSFKVMYIDFDLEHFEFGKKTNFILTSNMHQVLLSNNNLISIELQEVFT